MALENTTPASLEIHVLGPFRVLVDGSAVEGRRWSRRKPQLLVKVLALQPHRQLHRERLMELLWPELDAEAAANNLHKTIHLARHALEPELKSAAESRFILSQGQQVALRAPGGLLVDAEEFERRAAAAKRTGEAEEYEAALALYAGDLLPEEPYEDWAAARREQLRGQYQELLMKLALLYEARGEFEGGVAQWKRLLDCDPPNEEAHRRLMSLYAQTGDRRRALRQYEQCRDTLRRELEAEPEPATVELHERIIAGRLPPLPPGAARRERDDFAARASLAILPLADAGAGPDAEYLSDGITESIISNLAQLPSLRVMARSTVFRYKGREVDPREAGRELGVRAVLTGRVVRLGERLVIRAELVDTADGAQLWGGQYDRDFSDVLAVQEEIARRISDSLQLKLTGEEQGRLAKRHTASAEAYQFYLKGRYFWYKRTEEALKRSIEYFNQAIEEDPSYALAYDGLSDSYTLLALRGLIPPREALVKAKAAARKALEIDDTLGEAYASLAHVRLHDWDWSGLEEEFKRALELNPGQAMAYHWYSEYLRAMGRADESLAIEEAGQGIDPLSPIESVSLSTAYHYAGMYDQAIEQLRKGLEINPNHFLLHFRLGHSYLQKGMREEAIEEMQRAVTLSGRSAETLMGLGQVYAAAGKRNEMQQVLDELMLHAKEHYVSPYYVAKIHAAGGDREQAFAWLEKACEEHNPDLIELKVEPILAGLRADPRFRDLLRRVGLPA
jgi:DNA-binding SARP family transcriptional activator